MRLESRILEKANCFKKDQSQPQAWEGDAPLSWTHRSQVDKDDMLVSRDRIAGIIQANGLGPLVRIEPANSGLRNESYLVNDRYFMRFDPHSNGVSKFRSEALAYRMLASSSLPLPRLVALDETHQFGPYDYIILSRMPGKNAADSRCELSSEQVKNLAWEAGRALGLIHKVPFEGFGKLRDIKTSPFTTWAAYFNDYASRYLRPAVETGMLGPSLAARLQAALERAQPLLARVSQACLLHRDYQYENLLQVNGRLTGIVDFEWAMAGDPSYDFISARSRENMLPGSETHFSEGYQSVHRLDAEHTQRLELYERFQALKTAVNCRRQGDSQGARAALAQLNRLLA